MSSPRRFIVGIGVANYHDATLNLKRVRDDVEQVTGWFAERTRFKHERALSELAVDPTLGALQQGLSRWMKSLKPDDVVVIYLAAHGQVENDVAYVLCSDSPSSGLAGEAITGETLGGIIGQSPPNNVLVIMDACVAGRLGSSIQRAAEDTATKANTRADPDWAQAVVCSTYGRDPAHDGKFVDAFLRVVSQERWTGTSDEWIYIDRLMDGLKSEFTVPQVAERKVWGPTSARLIPNPNFATRRLGALIADVEVESHFDPASRGVLVGERGSYFMGRAEELTQIVKWLKRPSDTSEPDLLIITGSPGSGKSALLSRVITLSDPALRARVDELAQLPPATVPPEGSIDAVLWCRNKIFDQVVQDLARRLDVNARTVDALLPEITQRTPNITIAIDALDEAAEGEASRLARDLIRPLAEARGVKILVATRPQAVRGTARGSATNLLEELRWASATTIVLDDFNNRADMHRYVVARLTAASEPERKTPYRDRPDLADAVATRIVDAAGKSFLVAAVTARSLANRKEPVDVRAQDLQFPTEAGEALAAYIDRLAEPQVVIDILRPLAWAESAGLPWGPMWVPLANALASAYRPDGPIPEYTDASVASVLSRAGDLIVETTAREPVYRLFHEKLGEHLRRGISAAAANAAMARTMQALIAQAPLENAPPYVLAHIGTYLSRSPDGFETLYRLATNPEYERVHRLTFGHSTGFLKDVDLAIAAARAKTPVDLRSLTALCFVYSRSIAVAPAPIVDILARAGQMQRAERMANNITFAVERAWAFALLAPGFAKEDDIEEAHRCLAEAERALAAINLTHAPMAWSWVASSARDCGFDDIAKRSVSAAVSAAEMLRDTKVSDTWDLGHALFWAGLAARSVGDEHVIARLREILENMLAAEHRAPFRNQELQAASVLGSHTLLQEVAKDSVRYPQSPVRDGNLALALATAGLTCELRNRFDEVDKAGGDPRGEDETRKHYAWALTLDGRVEQALECLKRIHDKEEQARALRHVSRVLVQRGNDALLPDVRELATRLARSSELKVKIFAASVFDILGDRGRALALAEEVIALGFTPSESTCVAFRKEGSARRPISTEIQELSDQQAMIESIDLSRRGEVEGAKSKLTAIRIPRFRWEALAWIASALKESASAEFWLATLLEARLVGMEMLQWTIRFVAGALPANERRRLVREFNGIRKVWAEATFADQYESLRASTDPSDERTMRMTELVSLASRSTQIGRTPSLASLAEAMTVVNRPSWSPEEVRRLVESGSPGRRIFALTLMRGERRLRQFDVLVGLICGSMSAFEQYFALQVMDLAFFGLSEAQRRQLRKVLQEERKRYIKPDTDREWLAKRIEAKLDQSDESPTEI